MKKTIIIIVSVILILALAVGLGFYVNNKNEEKSETETVTQKGEFDIDFNNENNGDNNAPLKIKDESETKIEAVKNNPKAQVEITVDGKIKIESISRLEGRLCVTVKNISSKSIEYAMLKVSTGKEELHFKITALLKGKTAILICTENEDYNKDTYYTGWQLSDVTEFKEEPDLHKDKFQITAENGYITIKNKTLKSYENPVYICYKRKIDGILNGTETRRVTVDDLNRKEERRLSVPNFNVSECEIIFIDYDK